MDEKNVILLFREKLFGHEENMAICERIDKLGDIMF